MSKSTPSGASTGKLIARRRHLYRRRLSHRRLRPLLDVAFAAEDHVVQAMSLDASRALTALDLDHDSGS